MNKFNLDFLKSGKGILTIFSIIIIIITVLCTEYSKPHNIDFKYNGVIYKASSPQSWKPINIEFNGKLEKGLFKYSATFKGTVKLGDKIFRGTPINFDNNKMEVGLLESNGEPYGGIYIEDRFDKLTIKIYEKTDRGGYQWNTKDSWLISAPCNNRDKAVEISNKLIQKINKNAIIK